MGVKMIETFIDTQLIENKKDIEIVTKKKTNGSFSVSQNTYNLKQLSPHKQISIKYLLFHCEKFHHNIVRFLFINLIYL